VTVLDDAIRHLPEEIQVGHRAGDAAELVARSVVVRADSAGCTTGFLSACRSRNVGFFVTARSNAQLHQAISDADNIEGVWLEAVTKDGEVRDAAMVADLTELIDTSGLSKGTRLLVRKEPLHPGAQRSLFPSLDFRYWGFYTDQDGDPRLLDLTMRDAAHVESHIQRLKDSGLCRFPFTKLAANEAWMFAVMLSADLVRWFQLVCLDDSWRNARPKALRWGIFHAPGRLTNKARRRIVRVIDGWPTTEVILDAYKRIALITRSAQPIPSNCPWSWSGASRSSSVVSDDPCFSRDGGLRVRPGCTMADVNLQAIVAMASGDVTGFL